MRFAKDLFTLCLAYVTSMWTAPMLVSINFGYTAWDRIDTYFVIFGNVIAWLYVRRFVRHLLTLAKNRKAHA